MHGKIVKGIAGFYYVDIAGSGIYECKARGIFRKDGTKPLPGDNVEITVLDEAEKEGSIEAIFTRENVLMRPQCANVDQALVVVSLRDPKLSFLLLDRMLVELARAGLPATICIGKADLAEAEEIEKIRQIYHSAGYTVLPVSTKKKEGIEAVTSFTKEKTTVLTGPSGVGKSSLVNVLSGAERMETGEISRKLARGKNTTRHAELLALPYGGYVMDTPGFSAFNTADCPKGELERYFPEFQPFLGKCYYQGCAHAKEPDCAVKEAVRNETIAQSRYQNYLAMYEELSMLEKRRY